MKRIFSFLKQRSAISVLIALAAFVTVKVVADTTTSNFETFTLGSVHGQDGWTSPASCAAYDHAIVDNTYGYASFGTKSLRISNAVTSGCFDATVSKPVSNEAGETDAYVATPSGTRQPYFVAEWDFASTVPGAEQPGLSVVASPDKGDGGRMSWVQMRDTPSGLEVNFYDYQDAVPYGSVGNSADGRGAEDSFVFTNLASGLDRTVPHTIKIEMFLVDGPHNDVVKVYVDGDLKHTGTSWEDYFRWTQGPGDPEETAPVNESRVIRSILFRTGGTAVPATLGNGFLIDNLTTTSGPLPAEEAECGDFVFLAKGDVSIDRQGLSAGDIHANDDIIFKKGNPSTHTGNLSAVDDITIQTKNTIDGVATAGDDIDLQGTATVTDGTNPNTPVSVVSLPSLSFSAGGSNHTVPQNGSLTLGPGSYGNVVVGKNATLNLSAGDYFFKTLDAKQGADLAIDVSGGEVGINVVTKLTFGKQVEVVISSGEVGSNDVKFCSRQSSQLSIGEQARVLGSIIAPKATVVLSKNSRFRGSVCADQVKVSQGAVFLHHSSDDSLPKQDAPDLEDIDSEEEIVSVISDYELSANYPNPFNPSTTIKFAMPEAGRATLRIYALTGQLVQTLVDGEMSAGRHSLSWNGRDHAGAAVASGIYFYRLEVQKQNGEAAFIQTRRMALVK